MGGHSEKHAEAVGDEGGARRALMVTESYAPGCGRTRSFRGVLVVCALALALQTADGVKCFEGSVTYCGISNDGGARTPPGQNMFVEGPGWACADDSSGLTPTTIAPNCWDQASCEALQVALSSLLASHIPLNVFLCLCPPPATCTHTHAGSPRDIDADLLLPQTGNYDDPHNLSHSSPYDYVSEPTWTAKV